MSKIKISHHPQLFLLFRDNKKEIKLKLPITKKIDLKHGIEKWKMENPADVILVSSRLAGKVGSIDCHAYVCM